MFGCWPVVRTPSLSHGPTRSAGAMTNTFPSRSRAKPRPPTMIKASAIQIAGLVADPHKHFDKFDDACDALKYWDEFRTAHLEPDYTVTGRGRDVVHVPTLPRVG